MYVPEGWFHATVNVGDVHSVKGLKHPHTFTKSTIQPLANLLRFLRYRSAAATTPMGRQSMLRRWPRRR